jgi:hypothetical protein
MSMAAPFCIEPKSDTLQFVVFVEYPHTPARQTKGSSDQVPSTRPVRLFRGGHRHLYILGYTIHINGDGLLFTRFVSSGGAGGRRPPLNERWCYASKTLDQRFLKCVDISL